MKFVLAGLAMIPGAWLIVQTMRGRVKAQCCAPPADQDRRLQS